MTKVILDTNALMMLFQFKIDLKGELARLLGAYEIVVPDVVIRELQGIPDRKAKAALEFAHKFEVVKTNGGRGDAAVLAITKELKAVLVTNDAQLRGRARGQGVHVVHLRGKDHLALD